MAMNHFYDKMGGVKLKVVSPATFADNFRYLEVRGAIEAHLANFGNYEIGTSMLAQLYYTSGNGCDSDIGEQQIDFSNTYNGFVLVESGGCSYEEKARNIERIGGLAALVI